MYEGYLGNLGCQNTDQHLYLVFAVIAKVQDIPRTFTAAAARSSASPELETWVFSYLMSNALVFQKEPKQALYDCSDRLCSLLVLTQCPVAKKKKKEEKIEGQ